MAGEIGSWQLIRYGYLWAWLYLTSMQIVAPTNLRGTTRTRRCAFGFKAVIKGCALFRSLVEISWGWGRTEGSLYPLRIEVKLMVYCDLANLIRSLLPFIIFPLLGQKKSNYFWPDCLCKPLGPERLFFANYRMVKLSGHQSYVSFNSIFQKYLATS